MFFNPSFQRDQKQKKKTFEERSPGLEQREPRRVSEARASCDISTAQRSTYFLGLFMWEGSID